MFSVFLFLPGGRRPRLKGRGQTRPTAGNTSSVEQLSLRSRYDITVSLVLLLLSTLTSGVSLLGREARADEDDGAGRFPVWPLLLLLLRCQVSAGLAVHAADGRPEGGADRGALRQRGPDPVHPVGGRVGAGGVHGGDAPGQSPGPPFIRQPQPADARLAAVPGEGERRHLRAWVPSSWC